MEPASAVRAIKEAAGIDGTPHNIQRTFATLFNEGAITNDAVGNALNHAPTSTAGIHYIQSRLRALRPVYQQYEDRVLEEVGVSAVSEDESVDLESFAKYQAWLAEQERGD